MSQQDRSKINILCTAGLGQILQVTVIFVGNNRYLNVTTEESDRSLRYCFVTKVRYFIGSHCTHVAPIWNDTSVSIWHLRRVYTHLGSLPNKIESFSTLTWFHLGFNDRNCASLPACSHELHSYLQRAMISRQKGARGWDVLLLWSSCGLVGAVVCQCCKYRKTFLCAERFLLLLCKKDPSGQMSAHRSLVLTLSNATIYLFMTYKTAQRVFVQVWEVCQ